MLQAVHCTYHFPIHNHPQTCDSTQTLWTQTMFTTNIPTCLKRFCNQLSVKILNLTWCLGYPLQSFHVLHYPLGPITPTSLTATEQFYCMHQRLSHTCTVSLYSLFSLGFLKLLHISSFQLQKENQNTVMKITTFSNMLVGWNSTPQLLRHF